VTNDFLTRGKLILGPEQVREEEPLFRVHTKQRIEAEYSILLFSGRNFVHVLYNYL
jgi:hypothetical protein